ncbi:MAG: thymidylate synthase [Rhodothermales bacterium]|nr:thymidylate synthase [Rhodothermales bacterium]MBO6778523.1 thymidylate synthase [Rhodothermales bacterium]
MRQYLDLLRHVRDHGLRKTDRTGTGTLSVFGHQMRFDLSEAFPLVTTKKVYFRGLAVEMLWFLRGGTNIDYLNEHRVHIWDPWADEDGNLGPVYGKQWVNWTRPDGSSVNQIERVIDSIRNNPDSRRHIVNAWNAGEVEQMALPPCHMFYQFWVGDGRLSCQLYVRSNDLFLGAPFNIAEYALLTHMVAQQCDLDVGELVYTIGDAHIYLNHLDQIEEQLARTPYPLPQLKINCRPASIFDYAFEDFELVDYQYHPAIKAPVAV